MVSFESCGRGDGLVVSVLNSGLTAQGSSSGGYVFVLCSWAEATLFSLHRAVQSWVQITQSQCEI